MGEVYRAHDTRLNRDVAIKVLPESLTNDPERLQRFEQEARAAAALNHPNIVAVYQMSTHPGGISYLVTELLEGETLRDRVRRGAVPLRKAIEYGVQIAHGLAAPHEKGIVHRDLKPENLFITNDGRVKILDFGLAKVPTVKAAAVDVTLSHETDPGVVMGTVGYMAPEQVRGKTVDHRSDLFAFGTILYEMLTGKQTFHKPTSAETMAAILNEEPPSISQIAPATPPGLQRVVHRCLEKNPEQRFQSASDLAFALESLSDSNITSASGSHAVAVKGPARVRVVIGAVVLVLVAVAAAVTYFVTRPEPVPKVSNYVQLTHDGKAKFLAGIDGARLYLYTSGGGGYQGLVEMSFSGGEARDLPILPKTNMVPWGFSRDGQVLVLDQVGIPPLGAFYSIPVLGGSPRRLTPEVQDAAWSPDGSKLAYANGKDLFIARSDGTEPRKVFTKPDSSIMTFEAWSPDSSRLRFYIFTASDTTSSVWEVGTDGTGLRQVLPKGEGCCGKWTPDGKYFVYQKQGQLWALADRTGWFHRERKPIQLTSSPVPLTSYAFSPDGKKLFVVGVTDRGELTRYDMKSAQFTPFMGGISAEYASFSKDGQWVAYVSYPEGTLWRSKVDGSDRLQLTYGPGYVLNPRWSPDGKTIAYYEDEQQGHLRSFLVSPDGGSPQPLLANEKGANSDPNWSPDGTKIVFGGNAGDSASTIRIVDLTTRSVTTIPGSTGLFSPRWSPDGRYIPAFTGDLTKLFLYDMQTQKWSEVAKGALGWPNFTKDSQYLFMLEGSVNFRVLRLRISDRKLEPVSDLKNFVPDGHYGNSLSLAPDDSPLILRNAGTFDVYALDWQEP